MKKILTLALIGAVIATPALANKDYSSSKKSDSWFNKMDTNADGMISRSEHNAFGDRMFEEADANNDGRISRSEMRAEKQRHARADGYRANSYQSDDYRADASEYGNLAPAGGRYAVEKGDTPNSQREGKK